VVVWVGEPERWVRSVQQFSVEEGSDGVIGADQIVGGAVEEDVLRGLWHRAGQAEVIIVEVGGDEALAA
jgi:hypothetical protein